MRTPFGRHVFTTGGNREAAWLAGIRVLRSEVRRRISVCRWDA